MKENFKFFEWWGKIPQWLKVFLIFPLLFLNGFLLFLIIDYLQPLINFLILASIISFLLELVVKLLIKQGINRSVAVAIVLLSALIFLIINSLILIPILIQQLNELIINAPTWIKQANQYLLSLSDSPWLDKLDRFSINFDSIIQQITTKLSTIVKTLGTQSLNIFVTTINSIFDVLFIIIFTIFLLIGGDKFWQGLYSFLPNPWNTKIPRYFRLTFKDYFFSRLILVGIASIVRLIVFILLGVPSPLLFAFGIGVTTLVPLLGGFVTILCTLILIFKSGKLALFFFISAIIIDQVTDNVIAPRLMGEIIGLNPIWLIISLFIGAKIGGLLGIFLAVPVASVIKKIVDDIRCSDCVSIAHENISIESIE